METIRETMEEFRPPDGAAQREGHPAAGDEDGQSHPAGGHGQGADHAAAAHDHRKSHHSEKLKADLIARLNRIEGQIRGIKGMIEKDTYCDHVLNQISAVQSALHGVGKLLLAGHMRSCVVERIREGDLDVVDELLTTVNKLLK